MICEWHYARLRPHLCLVRSVRIRSQRSPADEGSAAVLAASLWALDGDVPVQARSADQAAATGCVTELVITRNCPDVLIHVAGLVQPAPAGEVIVRCEFRPYPRRRHEQLVGPESLAKRFQRLCAGIFLAYRKGIAPLGRPAAVLRVDRLPATSLPAALNSPDHWLPYTPSLSGRPVAEVPFRRAGSRLHGSRNDCSQVWCLRSRRRVLCQSSEHADRNFASRQSCLVLYL